MGILVALYIELYYTLYKGVQGVFSQLRSQVKKYYQSEVSVDRRMNGECIRIKMCP